MAGFESATGQDALSALRDSLRRKEDQGMEHEVMVRIHFVIVMIRWTGLAPWEFGFPLPQGGPGHGTRGASSSPLLSLQVLEGP